MNIETVDFDRVRIRAFVSRNDVMIQLQSYGISSEEARARVDSLTDQEIDLIASKLDQLPVGGDTYSTISTIACVFETAQYVYFGIIIGAIIILIVLSIIFYDVKDEPS
jgi:preprotein translocase subunit SecF